ncbi:hypothetical protein ACJX0J_030356, partial [Zea mays]
MEMILVVIIALVHLGGLPGNVAACINNKEEAKHESKARIPLDEEGRIQMRGLDRAHLSTCCSSELKHDKKRTEKPRIHHVEVEWSLK